MKYLYYLLFLIACTPAVMAQTAQEIVDRADANASFDHATMQATITSTDAFGTKVYETQIQQSGRDDSLIVFLAGENKGQKILRTPNELFVYYPDADNVVRLKGAALRQSAFGDVSYEDLANSKTRSDRFNLTLVSTENVDGFTTWVIDLVAKIKGRATLSNASGSIKRPILSYALSIVATLGNSYVNYVRMILSNVVINLSLPS